MKHPHTAPLLNAIALAVASLALAACGGGSGEPPPAAPAAAADTKAPTVTITDNVSDATATGAVTFSFTFDEDVGTSFTADDVSVSGGTAGAFTRIGGSSATLVVTPSPNTTGTLAVTVAAGKVSDSAGNTNAAASSQQAYNTVIPVIRTRLVSFEESPAPLLTGFGGAEDATVVADPTNAANKVAKVVKGAGAELWAGTTVSICPSTALVKLPFTATMTTLSARVWSPDAGIPVRLKIENAADGTQSVETEATTTVGGGWQTLSFNFANQAAGTAALNLATTYNKASIFFNFGKTGAQAGGAKTYYFDDLSFDGSSFAVACPTTGGGTGGGTATTSTISFDEGTAPKLTGFGGAEDAAVVADPTNAANKVARIIKAAGAELWAGTTVSTLAGDAIPTIGFTASNSTITARVWSPDAGIPVRLKVESATDGSKSVETEATTTVAAGWQTLSFNFANQAAGTAALNLATVYHTASIFFNFGKTGAQAGGAKTYYLDDLVFPAAAATGGTGSSGPLGFSSGYTRAGATAQGGAWGYFSGDFSSYKDTFTGGGFADSSPAVADADQYFFIAVTTSAPTAPASSPATSGGYLGMYVTYPGAGLKLTGQTSLAIKLGLDANLFKQSGTKAVTLFIVGATKYSNGSGGECQTSVTTTVTPTTDAMITYTVPLSSFTLAQGCNGGGFTAGVTTAAQALALPIGAVNSQLSFPNVNTTVNSGTAGAPVYATGLTRGQTEFR